MTISAKVLADSISSGIRLTTFQLKFPMTLMREFNTHRSLSRNASSSRAIPVSRVLDEVRDDPVLPVYWGANQAGMQSYQELPPEVRDEALKVWLEARDFATASADKLAKLGVHKQYANLLVDPFSWINVIATATDWDGFYLLRDHHAAKPEIQILAREMKKAVAESTPIEREMISEPNVESEALWHLPLVTDEERKMLHVRDLLITSAARCARVSYNKHDGTASTLEEDTKLFNRLIMTEGEPPHASPVEHQAVFLGPTTRNYNLRGWASLRNTLGI